MFDWTHLQTFLAVAEHGSLSGAARATGGSQPTMGRHIRALEASLAQPLFTRVQGGLNLTPLGGELAEHARQMSDIAGQIALTAAGQSAQIAGTIRLTASEIVAAHILPAMLRDLRAEEPEIQIEVVASDQTENLLRREADIAIRMYRPGQMDVITRHVADFETALFATPDYLDRYGEPSSMGDLGQHNFIGYDRSDLILNGFRDAGYPVDREFFAFRSDNQLVCWQMVRAGFGIGFNQRRIGLAEPAVRQVLMDQKLPALPVWLTAHQELKTSRRVRRVYDFLAGRFRAISD